jgi:hypothetical protein
MYNLEPVTDVDSGYGLSMTDRKRGLVRRLAVGAGTAGVGLLVLAVPGAAQAPGPTSTFQTSPTEGPVGTAIDLRGTCLFGSAPADQAVVRLARNVGTSGSAPFDTTVELEVDAAGAFAGQLVVPKDAPADEYTLSMNCLAADQAFGRLTGAFRVTATQTVPVAPPATPQRRKPDFTG